MNDSKAASKILEQDYCFIAKICRKSGKVVIRVFDTGFAAIEEMTQYSQMAAYLENETKSKTTDSLSLDKIMERLDQGKWEEQLALRNGNFIASAIWEDEKKNRLLFAMKPEVIQKREMEFVVQNRCENFCVVHVESGRVCTEISKSECATPENFAERVKEQAKLVCKEDREKFFSYFSLKQLAERLKKANASEESEWRIEQQGQEKWYAASCQFVLANGEEYIYILWWDRTEFALAREKGRIDGLTGLLNREVGEMEINARMNRGTLMLMDLDRFKEINDEFGHLAGDQVLRQWGGTLRAEIGEKAVLCRWGGDEVLVFFPEKNPETAMQIFEKIRERMAVCEYEDEQIPVSISAGVAVTERGDALYALFKKADFRLYAAKKNKGTR